MHKITVARASGYTKPQAPFPWHWLGYVWSLTGLIIPCLLIYMVVAHGIPAFWYETKNYRCTYVDVLGAYHLTAKTIGECPVYAFRKVRIVPSEFKQWIEEK